MRPSAERKAAEPRRGIRPGRVGRWPRNRTQSHPYIPFHSARVIILLVLEAIARDDRAPAQRLLDEAYRGLALDQSAIIQSGFLSLAETLLWLAGDRPERAAARAGYLWSRPGEVGFRYIMPEPLWLPGNAHLARGDRFGAARLRQKALVAAEVIGDRRFRWCILGALAALEGKQGHGAKARKSQKQARATILFIAAHTPAAPPPTFLTQPEVPSFV